MCKKVYLPSSFTKCIENCGFPDFVTDYQIRHLGNPSGLPEILPKIDPCTWLAPPCHPWLWSSESMQCQGPRWHHVVGSCRAIDGYPVYLENFHSRRWSRNIHISLTHRKRRLWFMRCTSSICRNNIILLGHIIALLMQVFFSILPVFASELYKLSFPRASGKCNRLPLIIAEYVIVPSRIVRV